MTALACGGLHSCVVLADGKMYAWGSNHEGQIGHVLRQAHGEPDTVSSMEHETCVKISCGRYSTLARHAASFHDGVSDLRFVQELWDVSLRVS